jgi:hypothetical protein
MELILHRDGETMERADRAVVGLPELVETSGPADRVVEPDLDEVFVLAKNQAVSEDEAERRGGVHTN